MTKAEQFIMDYTNHCSNEIESVHTHYGDVHLYHEWLTPEQALRAVEIEREELLEKAGKWIGNHLLTPYESKVLDDFEKAMKGE